MTIYYLPQLGGIEQFVSCLSNSLNERGHDVQVLCSHGGQPLPDEMECNGILIHRVPYMQGMLQRNPAILLRVQHKIREIVQTFRPDVIHLHMGGAFVHAYLSCPAFRSIPVVLTVHDLPENLEGAKTVRRLLQQANCVTTNSRIRLADILEAEPSIREHAQCLYVSKPLQASRTIVERSRHPVIFMAGRQVAEKGFDLAINAFAEVHPQYPHTQLVLAGNGPMHDSLSEQIENKGLNESARLLGTISAEELANCYHSAWFTLVPSRHSESFGLVALEAMQAGCAVVASRIGGLPEVIEDGVTGCLVEPNSITALAHAMLKLLEDPARTFAMGQAGRERARRLFDWDNCVSSYEDLLMRVATQRQR